MKAYISKRAARAVERINARWHAHADHPEVFAREFLEVIESLETTLGLGSPFPTSRRPTLKRLVLKKSRCHIYFEIDEPKQIVQILHVWDGRREREPKLVICDRRPEPIARNERRLNQGAVTVPPEVRRRPVVTLRR